jgi:hypothetical protein
MLLTFFLKFYKKRCDSDIFQDIIPVTKNEMP